MKLILDLKLAVTKESFISEQFQTNGTEKNILFVNPQLTGKHLYRVLLPLFKMRSDKIATAITSLSEFDTESQLFGENEWQLTDEMINWGKDVGVPVYIVFPFTTQPLTSEVYHRIRTTNPYARIVYSVDFNYYDLSNEHPYKYIFNEPSVISAIEDNMMFSDFVLVSSYVLRDVLVDKIEKLHPIKYVNDQIFIQEIKVMKYLVDIETMLGNVEYDIQEALSSSDIAPVHTPVSDQLIEKTAEVAEEVRKEEVEKKKTKGKKKPANGSSYKGTQKNKLKKQIKKQKASPATYGSKTKRNRTKRSKKK